MSIVGRIKRVQRLGVQDWEIGLCIDFRLLGASFDVAAPTLVCVASD